MNEVQKQLADTNVDTNKSLPSKLTRQQYKEAKRSLKDTCEDYIDKILYDIDSDKTLGNFLVPLQGKSPHVAGTGWEAHDKVFNILPYIEMEKKGITGYGLKPNRVFCIIDFDSQEAWDTLLDKLSDPEDKETVENTVSWTSGTEGRRTLLFIQSEYAKQQLTGKVLKLSSLGEGCLGEVLLDGSQAVLPGSFHPDTEKQYYWLNSIEDFYIKRIPDALVDILSSLTCNKSEKNKTNGKGTKSKKGNGALASKILAKAKEKYGDDYLEYIYSHDELCNSNNGEYLKGACPIDDNTHANDKSNGGAFTIYNDGKWWCFGHNVGGDCIAYEAFCNGEDVSNGLSKEKYRQYAKKLCERLGLEDVFTNANYSGDVSSYNVDDFSGVVERCVTKKLERDDYIVIDEVFYQYQPDKGYWKALEDPQVKKVITHHLDNCYKLISKGKDDDGEPIYEENYGFLTDSKKRSCINIAKSYLNLKTSLPNNNHLLSFPNGTFNLKTQEIEPHRKDNYLFYHIPHELHLEDNNPQEWLAFLEDSIGSEQIDTIRAFIRYLIDDTLLFTSGKFLHLTGASGSGKGAIIRTLEKIVGLDHSTSITSLSLLNNPGERHAQLTNKSLVTAPDMKGYQQAIEAFYELVDDGALSARPFHGSEGYNKRWGVKFAIASVEQLQIEDAGRGWSRRCIPVSTISKQRKNDHALESRFEIDQIIAWALTMPQDDVIERLFNTKTATQSELEIDQLITSDSVASFIHDCLLPADVADTDTTDNNTQHDDDLYHRYYIPYCRSKGLKPKGCNWFKRGLKTHIPSQYHVPAKSKRNGESVVKTKAYWEGIYLHTSAFTFYQKQFKNGEEQLDIEYNHLKGLNCGLEAFKGELNYPLVTVTGEEKAPANNNDEPSTKDKSLPKLSKCKSVSSFRERFEAVKSSYKALDDLYNYFYSIYDVVKGTGEEKQALMNEIESALAKWDS